MTYRREVIGPCELYLGDCRVVLPKIGRVDAVVTDPPFGIGEARKKRHLSTKPDARWSNRKTRPVYEVGAWDDKPIEPGLIDALRAMSQWQIIFGGNFYAMPPASCWLVWDKLNGENDFADCELAWTNLPKAVRRIQYLWNGFQRAHNEPRGDHPTQKPVGVMKWCIEHLPEPNYTILDPFMGSGTTGIAAVKLGRRFIGVEIKERYFNIACRRISAAVSQPDLFISTPAPKPVQEELPL